MAQNIEHKKSTLDDDASIYQKKEDRDESKSVKQRWAEMNSEEKKQHFKDYMLKPLLLGCFIVILVIYFLYTSFRDGKSNKFMLVSFSKYYLDNNEMEAHMNSLEKLWNFGSREEAVYSTDVALSDVPGAGSFATYLYAGSINAAIGTKEQLEAYGNYFLDFKTEGVLENIISQIPEEALCPLTYDSQDLNQTGPSITTTYSAIYLKYTIFADNINDNLPVNEDDLILVIPLSGIDEENGKSYSYEFLKYALGLEP